MEAKEGKSKGKEVVKKAVTGFGYFTVSIVIGFFVGTLLWPCPSHVVNKCVEAYLTRHQK